MCTNNIVVFFLLNFENVTMINSILLWKSRRSIVNNNFLYRFMQARVRYQNSVKSLRHKVTVI